MNVEGSKKIIESINELPPLQDGFIRLIHRTNKASVDSILTNGLDYSSQGMISATTRGWSKADEIEWDVDDPRFAGEDVVSVVIDMPVDLHRLHNNLVNSPGVIEPEYIVGVIRHAD